MQVLSKSMVMALLVLALPVLAQEAALQKGGGGKITLKKAMVVKLEDQATLMVNNTSQGLIKVIYFSGKSDVYINGPTLMKVLLPEHKPSSLAVFDGPLGVMEWVSIKALREQGYQVTFSKLSLELAIETPVANRLNQETSLKPPKSTNRTIKVTHQPAMVSGVVNVGGLHEISQDTLPTALQHGYDINGVLNFNQNLLRFWVIRPIPKTITLGSFFDTEKTELKTSDDWVWNTIALSRTDYNNGVSYVLGDVQAQPNPQSPFPSVWGLGIHSMGRSHLVNTNQQTTDIELVLTERSELVFEVNQQVIKRLVRNAGQHRFVGIPLKPFGNVIRVKTKPLKGNDTESVISKWVYIDPDILPVGQIESRFQAGVPLRIDLSGRQIDSSVWSAAAGFNMGVWPNTMLGSFVAMGNLSKRVGIDVTTVLPIGKLNVMPQFEQYGAYPVGHLQVGWTFLDASKEVMQKPVGISFKSYIMNFPFSDTSTGDLKYTMNNAVNVMWRPHEAVQFNSGLTHLMMMGQQKILGTLSGSWNWGWVKWGVQFQMNMSDQVWQHNQQITALTKLFQTSIQLGYYNVNQVTGFSLNVAWTPIPQFWVQSQQGLNYDNTEWGYQVNEGTKLVASQSNKYHDNNTNTQLQQIQMNQGNGHEMLDWMWSLKKTDPATPTANKPSTPYIMTHRLSANTRRFVSGFTRLDYNDIKPDESVLSWGSAIVFADGHWTISRPLSSGFMMVNVEGTAHAPEVYINKQPYYDALGASVYSQLNPYQSNSIEIEAISDKGDFLGSVPVRINPLPDQNYVVMVNATPRVSVSFKVKPFHQLRMMGQRVTIRRLQDDADDSTAIMIGPQNQVVLQDVYPGKYELTFSDSRLGRMLIQIADSVTDSKELGLIPLGSKTVTVYAN